MLSSLDQCSLHLELATSFRSPSHRRQQRAAHERTERGYILRAVSGHVSDPRRACARVTVVCLSVTGVSRRNLVLRAHALIIAVTHGNEQRWGLRTVAMVFSPKARHAGYSEECNTLQHSLSNALDTLHCQLHAHCTTAHTFCTAGLRAILKPG